MAGGQQSSLQNDSKPGNVPAVFLWVSHEQIRSDYKWSVSYVGLESSQDKKGSVSWRWKRGGLSDGFREGFLSFTIFFWRVFRK